MVSSNVSVLKMVVLGEAGPMEKCGCVCCGKARACSGESAGPAQGRNMMWYQ